MGIPMETLEPRPLYVLTVFGDPVPWQAAAKMGTAHNAPRKIPDRQSHHAGAIRDAWARSPGSGLWLEKGKPVRVVGHFYVCRPKDQYRSGRFDRELKPPGHPKVLRAPTGKPDLSNLLKMVEDALTGTVWKDDDQVTELGGWKCFINWWEQPKSVITVTPL